MSGLKNGGRQCRSTLSVGRTSSASLVRADSEDDLPFILDEVANPEGCEWNRYEGPLFINFRLLAKWHIENQRPDGPVAPYQVVVDDVGPMATASVVEALELSLGEGDDGLDTAFEIVRSAFPEIHAVVEKCYESGEGQDLEGGLPEAELREALHTELVRMLGWSWRRAQLQNKTDLASTLAREMDMPPATVLKYAERAQRGGSVEDVDALASSRAGVASEEQLFKVTNHHVDSCGQPPAVDADAPGHYLGYFANEYGEQAIYRFDYATGEATIQLADAGWENIYQVVDGRAEGAHPRQM
jgi:hypothetical protein